MPQQQSWSFLSTLKVSRCEWREWTITSCEFQTAAHIDRDCELFIHMKHVSGITEDVKIEIVRSEQNIGMSFYRGITALSRFQESREREYQLAFTSIEKGASASSEKNPGFYIRSTPENFLWLFNKVQIWFLWVRRGVQCCHCRNQRYSFGG